MNSYSAPCPSPFLTNVRVPRQILARRTCLVPVSYARHTVRHDVNLIHQPLSNYLNIDIDEAPSGRGCFRDEVSRCVSVNLMDQRCLRAPYYDRQLGRGGNRNGVHFQRPELSSLCSLRLPSGPRSIAPSS